jgi:hypothetical protein
MSMDIIDEGSMVRPKLNRRTLLRLLDNTERPWLRPFQVGKLSIAFTAFHWKPLWISRRKGRSFTLKNSGGQIPKTLATRQSRHKQEADHDDPIC